MYNEETLSKMSFKELVDAVVKLQNENTMLTGSLARIRQILDVPKNPNEKRGRPRHTPEQKAAAYEAYKEKKRMKYALSKLEVK